MEDQDRGVGYVSYEWIGAPAGVIDAFAGGTALIGIDEAIRFFNRKQNKGFASAHYEIPISTEKGSWVAVVLGVLAVPGVAFATAYAKKAGEKMAERDFKEIGFREITAKSMDALVKLIKLTKAKRGKIDWKKVTVDWSPDASIGYITGADNEVISVPAEYLRWYPDAPASMLRKLSAPIAKGRYLTVGAAQNDGTYDIVNVDETTSSFLDGEDVSEESEFLFPEMEHGNRVTLEGIITRGNQSTNSIGFQYRGHILNCTPETGSVKRFKSAMFLQCRLTATVNRHVTSLARLDYRPTLLVSEIVQLEDDSKGQPSLFR